MLPNTIQTDNEAPEERKELLREAFDLLLQLSPAQLEDILQKMAER